VYRKLHEDVAGFWGFLFRESERLRGAVDARFAVWLASRMVGRWPNGTPLALSPDSDNPSSNLDAFGYAQDPLGLACPVGAHIRRSNPRDHLRPAEIAESRRMTARHRLLRRGRSYGEPLFPLTVLDDASHEEPLRAAIECEDDGAARGVHFLCVNASIKGQFEFVQQAWINNPRFGGLVDNPDPLAGSADDGTAGEPGRGRHTVPGCPAGIQTSLLPRFVTVRGGVYAFLPSLTALRYLAREG
jgi:deferrochelatase/peroxidase EfeB